ncbi:ABC transporter substrate-binding protein [Streptomyces luomodiensis]|uniref:ABC transporter substrate-binding protein n=1 Tax=Streptomyces luomodiensis TaxID=3026192 RepID=A0ABY9UY48_9ACTN|nr:ABC transporter substrate-binding protein [Streptomyces sp. SCA4-21]WNE97211.1 ABC transporter substrate-binding protein [Streptomyces sp. SCA4-21]
MTGRRRPSSRPIRAAVAALSTAVGASLLTGCGTVLPNEADDAPITVMTWAPQGTKATNMPGMPAMAQAFARWVNDTGGIHGRELHVVTCNEHNDAVQAARCAQRAQEEKAVAVVGSYSQFGRAFISPLEVAGIPYIGGYGLTQEEFDSPYSYPVNGGQAALLAGNGRQLASRCEHVALVRPDTIAGDELPQLLSTGLKAGGRAAAQDVRAPEDAGDYSKQATSALERVGADSALGTAAQGATLDSSCVTAALGNRTGTFFDSFRRVQDDHPKVRIASILGSVRQSLVDSTGGSSSPLEGTYATGWYPAADDARWDPMKKVINKYAFDDNRIDPNDPGTQTTWIGYTVLRSVLMSLNANDISARTVRNALDDGHAVDTGGLTPTLRWGYDDTLHVPNYSRIVNAHVTYQVVRNGRLVAVRKGFVDMARTLENYHPAD